MKLTHGSGYDFIWKLSKRQAFFYFSLVTSVYFTWPNKAVLFQSFPESSFMSWQFFNVVIIFSIQSTITEWLCLLQAEKQTSAFWLYFV